MTNKVEIPNITKDLAYLCGVLAGDGNINIRPEKHDYSIKCVGNPKDEKEYYKKLIVPLFDKIFNLKVKARHYDKGTTYGIRIWSKELVYYLTNFIELPSGKKYNKLKIPSIFKKNELLLKSFIQGVADTDFGLSFKKKGYPVIVGSSNTKSFMEEIGNELDKFGLSCIRCFDYKRKDPRFKKGYSIIHRLELNGHSQLTKWMDIIGFRHPKHNKKVEIWRKRYTSGGWKIRN